MNTIFLPFRKVLHVAVEDVTLISYTAVGGSLGGLETISFGPEHAQYQVAQLIDVQRVVNVHRHVLIIHDTSVVYRHDLLFELVPSPPLALSDIELVFTDASQGVHTRHARTPRHEVGLPCAEMHSLFLRSWRASPHVCSFEGTLCLF